MVSDTGSFLESVLQLCKQGKRVWVGSSCVLLTDVAIFSLILAIHSSSPRESLASEAIVGSVGIHTTQGVPLCIVCMSPDHDKEVFLFVL